ncbi:MAG: hypothetical protein U0169_21760 [Polyangiaceae bacterium]
MNLSKALATALFVAMTGCGSNYVMSTSPGVPGAEGTVVPSRSDQGNTEVELTVKHLPPPEKIASGAKVFVVWVQPADGKASPNNVGALKVDEDHKGKLKTMTPFKSFNLFVTPEDSGEATAPSGQKVLWTSVSE